MSFVYLWKKAKNPIFQEFNFSIELELEFILIKKFDVESHIKGYDASMNEWTPEIGGILKNRLEPEKAVDWFAVAVEKEDQIVALLNKTNSGRFAKIIFFFLCANHGNTTCHVEVRGKMVNLCDGQGLHVVFNFQEKKNIEKYWKTVYRVS